MTISHSLILNTVCRRFLLCAAIASFHSLPLPAFGAEAQAAAIPAPSAKEKAELEKYPSYIGNIEVIAANEGNGLQLFLDENAGKTVFIETTVLRYRPTPQGVTKETREKLPPTDRFENTAFEKCWGGEDNRPGRLESGDDGFPLPLDAADIEAGCAARIKFELLQGEYGENVQAAGGFDKREIYFIGFFEVKKETLKDGKTLYRLTETAVADPTAQAFYTHATKKDRPIRSLSVDAANPAEDNKKAE